MEEDKAKRDETNEPNSQGVNAKPDKENGAMWEPEEEYDEGWAVDREQYWSNEEESQPKQAQGDGVGQYRQTQSNHEWRTNKPNPYPSEEENKIWSDESNLHKSEDEVITAGESDTQKETSTNSDSDISHSSVKGLMEWEQTTQQMFVKESWEDDSILEGEEEKSKERVEIERK